VLCQKAISRLQTILAVCHVKPALTSTFDTAIVVDTFRKHGDIEGKSVEIEIQYLLALRHPEKPTRRPVH
jgi:predicted ABC-class ATPase